MDSSTGLTVAVTGPTGTFGFGLMPLLEADDRIDRVVGIARRPFVPAAHGWSKMTYRQGDVRDADALELAFESAGVVVHLAFLITGGASREVSHAINVDGTRNAFRAAARAGASRFVYASSVAAYGFHADNPVGMQEDWPTRPATFMPYAQEKAELEELLAEAAAAHPEIELYVLRPPIVVGPHAMGAKDLLPAFASPLARRAADVIDRVPFAPPVPLPALPLQLIHEDDVGQAFLQCIVGAGPPGAYNIAGDGVLTAHDVAAEVGLRPVTVPLPLAQRAARGFAALPWPSSTPALLGWIEAASHPAILDTTKAKRELGWRPRYTGLEALRATLHPPKG